MTAKEVKKALDVTGLTLREMGIRVGVTQETIWRWSKKGCPKRTFEKKIEAIVRAEQRESA